jgi:hypothetical protein
LIWGRDVVQRRRSSRGERRDGSLRGFGAYLFFVKVLMEAVSQNCYEVDIKPEERNLNNKGKTKQVK